MFDFDECAQTHGFNRDETVYKSEKTTSKNEHEMIIASTGIDGVAWHSQCLAARSSSSLSASFSLSFHSYTNLNYIPVVYVYWFW